jgi:hypothetical protein
MFFFFQEEKFPFLLRNILYLTKAPNPVIQILNTQVSKLDPMKNYNMLDNSKHRCSICQAKCFLHVCYECNRGLSRKTLCENCFKENPELQICDYCQSRRDRKWAYLKTMRKRIYNKTYKRDRLCHCRSLMQRWQVYKNYANRGRYFYACGQYKCNAFQWDT